MVRNVRGCGECVCAAGDRMQRGSHLHLTRPALPDPITGFGAHEAAVHGRARVQVLDCGRGSGLQVLIILSAGCSERKAALDCARAKQQ